MKRLLFVIISLLSMSGPTFANETLQTIFNQIKVKTTLEFGFGDNTNYFLDSSKKVISIEFITHGYGPETLKQGIECRKSFSNWVPIAFFSGYHGDTAWATYRYYGSDSVYKATSHRCSTHESFAKIDDFYITELNSFITNLKKCYKIDVAYVGGSILIRGDIVQILFGKVPVIIGANTTQSYIDDPYGYKTVKVPEDYEEIFMPSTSSTVWISKHEDYKLLAQQLRTL